MKTLEEELTGYWTIELDELHRIQRLIGKIADLRAECRTVAPKSTEAPSPPNGVLLEVPATAPIPVAAAMNRGVSLRARRPMRAPKPGSLRSRILETLRQNGKPMQRADIIGAVAQQRGQQVDEILKAKIGDALTNKHDPIFRRLAHGVYTIGKEA